MIRSFLYIFVALWFLGAFIFYYLAFIHVAPCSYHDLDGIVVLTGDDGRIQEGNSLNEQFKPKHLFISGVSFEKNLGNKDNVVLGYSAKNTIGNIHEIQKWIDQFGLNRILIVTHDYHIPRVRLLIKNKAIMYHRVHSKWSLRLLKILFLEYHKLLLYTALSL